MNIRQCANGLVMLAALSATVQPAATQETGSVRGTVVDASTRKPLSGAQVFITETGQGSLTDASGRYLVVNVPAGENTVRVQLIGYARGQQAVTVTPGEAAVADFQLTQMALELDEVVITGTAGGARAREVGSAISTIRQSELEAAPVVNMEQILQGRAAGVTVLANSGQPGAGGTIRLRGNNSVTQGNQPLVYVDGIRVYSGYGPTTGGSMQAVSPLNDISPSEIERIEIVKGPAATTLYGTEASGGVIQIFTKTGQQGGTRWSAGITTGFNNLEHIGPKSDPTGLTFVKCRGPELVDARGRSFTDVTCPESGSWLRNGLVQRFNIGVRGGGLGLAYGVSADFNAEDGVLPTSWSKDGGFRANFGFTPTPTLEFTFNNSFNTRATRWVPEGNRSYSFILNVARGPFNQFKTGGDVANALILEQETYDRTQHFITGFSVNHKPTDQFSQQLKLGYDYNAMRANHLAPLGFQRFPTGYFEDRDWLHTTLSLDYVASLRTSLRDGISSVSSVGGQLFEDRDWRTEMLVQDFAAPGIVPTLTTGARRDVQADDQLRVINGGFFLQQIVGFNDQLFITAGLRVDGNSAFGENFGLQPYPKVSASYIVSEHDFWPSDRWGTLKLRAAVGEAGKAPGAFDATRTWLPISADAGSPGFTTGRLGNPDLGPERTREYEIGFDASILGGRLTVESTYYQQTTFDALIPVLPIPTLGFVEPQLQNLGKLQNRGFEALVDASLIRNPTVEWSGRVNLATSSSKALDLGGENILISDVGGAWVREGYPVPSYFGDVITNPDEFADPVIESDQFIGPMYPTTTVGVGTTLNLFQRLELDVSSEYQGGAYNQNATGWLNARRGIWQPCYAVQEKLRAAQGGDPSALNDVTALERAKCAISVRNGSKDWWTQPTDFFKIRHASLTYTLPSGWIPRTQSAAFTLSGRNLFTSTEYDGLDPEVTDSGFLFWRREYYNMPPVRTFLASLRITF